MHRHLGHNGERRIVGGQEPGGRRRGLEAVRGPHRRQQHHLRDARARHRFVCHRRFSRARPWHGHRCRHTAGHLRRGTSGAPARGLGGDAAWYLVLRGRSALGPGEADDGDRRREQAVGGSRSTRGRLRHGAARASSRVERPRAGTDLEPWGKREQLLLVQAPPVHLGCRPRVHDDRAARRTPGDGGGPAIPSRSRGQAPLRRTLLSRMWARISSGTARASGGGGVLPRA